MSENINCSGFLLPSISQDALYATLLVVRSMMKLHAQWKEIPSHIIQ